jgi:single-strand DNA-binding protein
MSKDLNQCNFIGRIGNDPDVRAMPNGTTVVNLSLAVGDDYKDKQGNKVEQTEWVRCTLFGKLGDVAAQYLKKGSKIHCTGKLKTRKYDKDGTTHYVSEIHVSDMQMLDGKPQDSAPAPRQKHKQAVQPAFDDDFADSDIPFN